MHYESETLLSGLRLIHYPTDAPVSYCGFAINAGTRDESLNQFGIAHFLEHMIFKGTLRRNSREIINRMENVGGELNAYTTKEETVVYSIFMEENFERALEVLSDLVFNSNFPQDEIVKERDVILDEINSYKDNPSELIFDEFENFLFREQDLGHYILGEPEMLNSIGRTDFLDFHRNFYFPRNIVFFSMGKTPFKKVFKLASKYLNEIPSVSVDLPERKAPETVSFDICRLDRRSYQCHVMIGSEAPGMFDKGRMPMYLLNNLLGGPGMNSRLNLSLREKRGLVYNVESNLSSYTDVGVFSIYFGCDQNDVDKCILLINNELRRLRNRKLSDSQLFVAKKQLKGQMGILNENSENKALSMGKNFLHRNKYDSLEDQYEKIDKLTASELLEVANEFLTKDKVSNLTYF